MRTGDRQLEPTREEIFARVASMITELAKIPASHVTEDATVDAELQMQSVAFVELQVAIEEAYDIQVDPIQIVELNRFGTIIDYVQRLITTAAV